MTILRTPITFFCLLAILCTTASAQLAPRKENKDKENERRLQFIKESALRIDKLIGLGFRRSGIRPIPKTSDATFVRRIYLDAIGRIPTYDETTAFINDTDKGKRSAIVDRLLNSPGYMSHQFNWWADLLRAKSDFDSVNTSGRPYINWIKQSIAENKPFDKMVHQLLSASGSGWEPGNGAVGYYLRDNGMPLDNMANTTRIFLGMNIECAQCHNHPEPGGFKQKEFFEMAAFTHGIKPLKENAGELVTGDDRDSMPRDLYDLGRQLQYDVFEFGLRGGGDGMIKLPKDYQYRDAKPGEPVAAKTQFGKRIRNGKRKPIDDGRTMLADWVTSPSNPRFTKLLVNRMWKRVMGMGVIEPVDDLNDAKKIGNMALLNLLEEIMVSCKYDLRQFQTILFSTRTYELGTNTKEISRSQSYDFRGRPLKRMSAEQIWDSMLAITIPDSDLRLRDFTRQDFIYNGKPVLVGKKTMLDLWTETKDMDRDAFWKYTKELLAEIKKSGGGGKSLSDASMMSMKMMGGASHGGLTSDPRWKGFSTNLLRASELESPTPPTHFLRKFGQSSRDVIEGATTESDVTQVLSLINGHVESTIIGKSNTVIYRNLAKAKSPEDKINVIYTSILNRPPGAEEMEVMLSEVKAGGDGYDNLIWALLNSHEFMFIQ